MPKRKLILTILFLTLISAFFLQLIIPVIKAEASASPKATTDKVTLYVGYKNYKIKLTNTVANAVITYASADNTIAKVTSKGTIKPVAKGITTITVIIKQKKKTYTSTMKVTVKTPHVSITKSVNALTIGARYTFKGKAVGVKNPELIWSSSNYTLANIDTSTGRLTAIRPGTVKISLTDKTSGKSKIIIIDISEADVTDGILAEAKARKKAILNSKTDMKFTGSVYYVSNSGNDNNDGLTKATAWATIAKVNTYKLEPVDTVLFERGGLWREPLIAQKAVTYSAWGEGDKPKIYGSPENGVGSDKWKLLDGTQNIWVYYKDMTDCGTLVFNDDENCALKELPSYLNGQFVLRDNNNVNFDVRKELDHNLEFFSEADSYLTNGAPYRYGMEDTSTVVGKLYLRCDEGNPGVVFSSIEFLTRGFVITPSYNCTFNNLCIKYSGSHAISCWGMQLTVQSCEIGWIGGSVQFYNQQTGKAVRYGNAVEASGSYAKYEITDCYVHQIYDAGLTNQDTDTKGAYRSVSANIVYSGNLVEYCTYGIEIFLNTGKPDINDHYMKNLQVEDNIILFTGYGWGSQRPDTHTASSIQMWDYPNPANNFVIRDNIFYLSTNYLLRCGAEKQWRPLLSGNTYVQYKDGMLGRWPANYETKPNDYSFSEINIQGILQNIFGDPSPTVISLDE